MHSSLLDQLLTYTVAVAMAILEFLLRCFRRRSPEPDHKRPLCTQEDSAQDASTDDTQLITTQQPVRLSDTVQASPRFSGQHESPSGYFDTEGDSNFGFTEVATAAQVWPAPLPNSSAAYAEMYTCT